LLRLGHQQLGGALSFDLTREGLGHARARQRDAVVLDVGLRLPGVDGESSGGPGVGGHALLSFGRTGDDPPKIVAYWRWPGASLLAARSAPHAPRSMAGAPAASTSPRATLRARKSSRMVAVAVAPTRVTPTLSTSSSASRVRTPPAALIC